MADIPSTTLKNAPPQRVDPATEALTSDTVLPALLQTQQLIADGRVPPGHMQGVVKEVMHQIINEGPADAGTKDYVKRYLDRKIDQLPNAEHALTHMVTAARPGHTDSIRLLVNNPDGVAADMLKTVGPAPAFHTTQIDKAHGTAPLNLAQAAVDQLKSSGGLQLAQVRLSDSPAFAPGGGGRSGPDR